MVWSWLCSRALVVSALCDSICSFVSSHAQPLYSAFVQYLLVTLSPARRPGWGSPRPARGQQVQQGGPRATPPTRPGWRRPRPGRVLKLNTFRQMECWRSIANLSCCLSVDMTCCSFTYDARELRKLIAFRQVECRRSVANPSCCLCVCVIGHVAWVWSCHIAC